MIDRILRRLSVRQRMLMMVLALAAVMVMLIPLLTVGENRLSAQGQRTMALLRQVDRLLLQAQMQISASHLHVLRYLEGRVASPTETLMALDAALGHLNEAQVLMPDLVGSQEGEDEVLSTGIRELRLVLADTRDLIGQVQGAKLSGNVSEVTRLEGVALATADHLDAQIAGLVARSQLVLESVGTAHEAGAGQRLIGLVVLSAALVVGTLVLAMVVSRSITGAVERVRRGAERLGVEAVADATPQSAGMIPVEGNDELAFLARTLNAMTTTVKRANQELETRVAVRTRDLQRRLGYLQAVIGVSRATTGLLDVNVLVQEAVEMIRERFGVSYVGLFLSEGGLAVGGGTGEQGMLALRAGTGEAGARMLARGHRLEIGQGMVGWAVANGQARVSLEAGADLVRTVNSELPETKSEAAIPLRARGRVIGALTVQDDAPGAFDEEAVDLLQVMADLLAVTIENATLYSEAQAALQTVQRVYGQATREGWQRVLSEMALPGGVRGYRLTPQGTVSAAVGPWEDGMRRAVEKFEVIQEGATLVVPIAARGQAVGAVRLQKTAPRAGRKAPQTAPEANGAGWAPREVSLVQTVVEQLGLALDSARLYEDTQLSAARERTAREITDRMRATLDWDELMQTAVQEIGRAVQASRVYVQWAPPSERRAPDEERSLSGSPGMTSPGGGSADGSAAGAKPQRAAQPDDGANGDGQ